MTQPHTLADLKLAARIIRRRAHDRDADLARLGDDVEETGDSAAYDEARIDALSDAIDDLWLLLDRIDALPGTAAAQPVSTQPVSTQPVSTQPVSTPAGGRPSTFEAVPYPAAPDAVPYPVIPEPTSYGDAGDPRDRAPHLSDDDSRTAAPLDARDAIERWLAELPNRDQEPTAAGIPLPTVALRMRRDSADYRRIFHPKPGQLTIAAGSDGERLADFHVAALDLLGVELRAHATTFVVLAVLDDDRPANAAVVSGWATGMIGDNAETAIAFADGTEVPFYDVAAVKLG